MSLYSKAQADKALYLFPLDGTISDTWGHNNLVTSYSTISAPTKTTDSRTGSNAYVFDGNNGISFTKVSRTSPPTSGSDTQVELVFKTTTAASSGNQRVIYYRPGEYGGIMIGVDGTGHVSATQTVNSYTRSTTSSATVTDGKWHYVVVRWEAGYLKVYVDGTLSGTSDPLAQTPRADDGYTRYIGYRPSAFEKFIGTIDFVADYLSGYTGILFDIASHFAEISNYINIPVVAEASALAVHPSLNIQQNISAAPMTASAASGNHFASNFNIYTGLNAYMDGMTLEERLYFDFKSEKTSGTNESLIPLELYSAETYNGIGPSGAGALRVGSFTDNGNARIGLSDTLTDRDLAVGLWFKLSSASPTDGIKKYIMATTPRNANGIMDISHINGQITFTYKTSAATRTHTVTTNHRDNTWHFAAIKDDGSDIKFFLDGTQVHTQGLGGTRSNVGAIFFGTPSNLDGGASGDSTNIQVAGFFITSTANCSNGTLASIYAAGNHAVQAGARINDVIVKFNNSWDDYVEENIPVMDFRFNENNTPLGNFANPAPDAYAILDETAGVVKYVTTKNKAGYLYETASDYTETNVDYVNLDADTRTDVLYAKMATVPTGENHVYVMSVGDFDTTTGLMFGADDSGPWIAMSDASFDPANWDYVHTNDTSLFNGYHLYTATKDGSTLKLYVDGKYIASTTTAIASTVFGETAFGALENYFFGGSSSDVDRYIDEFKVFNYAMTAKEQFELWQHIGVEPCAPASSLLVNPAFSAGTGFTHTASALTASADIVMPTQFDQIIPTIVPMTAFITTVMPNYIAEILVDANYASAPMTASGVFHMPQYEIGEINGVDFMSASATMPNALFSTPGRVQVNPGIALGATLVMPGLVTIKGAKVFAETLTARAIMPLPPTYIQLTDDEYYNRLYRIHAQQRIQPIQTNLSSLPNQATTEIARSFLSFFDDVSADITPGSTHYVYNEMPEYVYADPTATRYDNNGNIIPPNTGKAAIDASAPRGANTPTPIISKGYFDAWDRKAVNITNIELNTNTDNPYWNIGKPYSLEFTIKTTKSNQIIAYGDWKSFQYYQSSTGTIGLFDGKIYSMETYDNIGKSKVVPHPKNVDALAKRGLNTSYITSNKRIDDGQWHHVVFQRGWDDYRTQIWIDGELDRQFRNDNYATTIRPSIIGFNSTDPNFSSDFQTSVISWIPQGFLNYRDIELNYERAFKYTPYEAEPMYASVTATQNTTAAGNRGRLLMLYFWPTNTAQRNGNYTPTFDTGSGFDKPTFESGLDTVDYIKQPPQEYEGWDVFPVDVTGYFVSDLVKKESYGGIVYGDAGGHILTTGDLNRAQWKFNAELTFRDDITDSPRYLDVLNDVDLKLFDAIAFKNFPDQSVEIDRYARDEVVDSYFNLRESKIYQDFIDSLRAAVDTGISLYVTNTELALDLGIIDRIEIVSDMDEITGYESDPYAPTIAPADAAEYPISAGETANVWYDTYKNNRMRLVNEVPGMTDYPTWIYTDAIYWRNDDVIKWGGPDRLFSRIVEKPNGLAVGDEWIESSWRAGGINAQPSSTAYQAVPFENIKAGIPITAFANQIRMGLELVDNPYKNYATSIIVRPGDPLKGRPCGGKIYVNFTEYLDGSREETGIDLITDSRIDAAYEGGAITLDDVDILKSKSYNLDRQLENGTIAEEAYNDLAFWTSNGSYVLQQNTQIGDDSDSPKGGGIIKPKSQRVRKINKNGGLSFQSVGGASAWFSVAFSWAYPRVSISTPSMLTRAWWWVSNKESLEGTVVRIPAMTASATLNAGIAIPDKDKSVQAPAMIANTRFVNPVGYIQGTVDIITLPLEASAMMNNNLFVVLVEPMKASIILRPGARAITTSIDEVTLYVMHEDPILYVRKEVIK